MGDKIDNLSRNNHLRGTLGYGKLKSYTWAIPVFVALSVAAFCASKEQIKASFPSAEISNGYLHATIALPDPDRGYYRGSRFDWSGVISQVLVKQHNYFGVWFPRYDPQLHDAITGPVEEFRTGNGSLGSALGFEQAKVGGMFVKIGVGVLRKPDDKPYSFARQYEIVNHGVWTSRPESDRVEFEQDLRDDYGYSYQYRKTVRLLPHKPELVLEHRLKNTGKLPIDTDVYDHDFYMLDGLPTGPATRILFTFHPEPAAEPGWSGLSDLAGKAAIHGNELAYTRELQAHEQAASLLKGFGNTAKDNDIRVENKQAGIGVREIGDRPLSRLNLWSIRTTVCPEAFIHLHVEPGKDARWKIRYVFYQLK